MPKVAVVYFSGFGHTKALAEHVLKGVTSMPGVTGVLIDAGELPDPGPDRALTGRWAEVNNAETIVFGTPTYMGSVAAGLKRVFEASGGLWYKQAWKDKLAAGFTNSGSFSGDKLNTLQDIWHNCMQHGMVWIGTGIMPDGNTPDSVNRLGSFAGLMAQSDNAPADQTPPTGDRKTAELFGRRIAEATLRWSR
jgi:multimeric flavodoxin WrbA